MVKERPLEEMLEILELNPLSNEELNDIIFIVHEYINTWCIMNKNHEVQESLNTKNYLLGKRRGDSKIFVSLDSTME